jgi:Heterokaryon incompatibility protein (HET)
MAVLKSPDSGEYGKLWLSTQRADIYKSGKETGFVSLWKVSDGTSTAQFRGRLLDVKLANFALITDWLELCLTRHSKLYSLTTPRPTRNLKLTDCERRLITSARDGCAYLALIYVWGTGVHVTEHIQDGCLLPEEIPWVIEDALMATLHLNFRYLWVDRYCIPQNDDGEKHAQITSVGLIYANAVATIVAAAGADSSIGLPGAGHRPRRCQAQARIGHVVLRSTMPDPKLTIEMSKWMTRAWTYQEGCSQGGSLSSERIKYTTNAVACIALKRSSRH